MELGMGSTRFAYEQQTLGTNMHYSRWPDPWHPEDDWGPIIAAVMLLIILGGLIVSGSGVHL
jgi:hypothetical protein